MFLWVRLPPKRPRPTTRRSERSPVSSYASPLPGPTGLERSPLTWSALSAPFPPRRWTFGARRAIATTSWWAGWAWSGGESPTWLVRGEHCSRSWDPTESRLPFWPKGQRGRTRACTRPLTASFKSASRRSWVIRGAPLRFWRREPAAYWLWRPIRASIPTSSRQGSLRSNGRICSLTPTVHW